MVTSISGNQLIELFPEVELDSSLTSETAAFIDNVGVFDLSFDLQSKSGFLCTFMHLPHLVLVFQPLLLCLS